MSGSEMGNGKGTYGEINEKLKNRKDIISVNFFKETVLIEEIIEESFYLSKIIDNRILTKVKKTGRKLYGPKALPPTLFKRNNHYLIASYKLALDGLNNPCGLILRSVFETILQLYLVHLTREEARLFYKKEVNKLTPVEEKEVKKKYQYFKPKFIRELLYEGDKLDQHIKFYEALSISAHPSIKQAYGDFSYKEENTKDNLWLIMMLGCANIIAFGEIYHKLLESSVAQNLEELIKRIALELESYPDLIPNKPEYKRKLKLKFIPM